MAMVQVPGKVSAFTNEQSERFAASLKLATAAETRELRSQLKKVEKDVAQLARRLDAIEARR